MTALIALVIAAFLATAAGFHLYWGLGGRHGWSVAVPQRIGGEPLFVPGAAATLAVAAVLLVVLVSLAFYALPVEIPVPRFWLRLLMAGFGLVFLARGLIWHDYVGFFKKVRATGFGRNDTWFYSPACVLAGIGFLVLAWHG